MKLLVCTLLFLTFPVVSFEFFFKLRAASQEAIKRNGFRSSSKLNALMTEIRVLPPGTKCIVFSQVIVALFKMRLAYLITPSCELAG